MSKKIAENEVFSAKALSDLSTSQDDSNKTNSFATQLEYQTEFRPLNATSDVCESTPVITSAAAALPPE
eukprot:6405879-Pyramimonas_sp.AAC.1